MKICDVQHMNFLHDFYGTLLTKKQSEVYLLRHMEDCSLAEIAEVLNTSPQAVLDLLKRTERKLEGFESRLGLIASYEKNKETVTLAIKACDRLEEQHGSNDDVALVRSVLMKILR